MAVTKDVIGRRIFTDQFNDVELYLDVDGETMELYFGHTHPAVNERLEALEVSIMFDADTLIPFVRALVHAQAEMRKAELKNENK